MDISLRSFFSAGGDHKDWVIDSQREWENKVFFTNQNGFQNHVNAKVQYRVESVERSVLK